MNGSSPMNASGRPRACAGLGSNDLNVDVTMARKGFAEALLGRHHDAVLTLAPLRVDRFPIEERLYFFSSRVLIWLLANRVDAARDVLEVDFKRQGRILVWPSLGERYRLAEAVFHAFDGGGEKHRHRMESVARRGWNCLNRLIARLLLAHLHGVDGRTGDALALLEAAAAMGPNTMVHWLLQSARERSPSAD